MFCLIRSEPLSTNPILEKRRRVYASIGMYDRPSRRNVLRVVVVCPGSTKDDSCRALEVVIIIVFMYHNVISASHKAVYAPVGCLGGHRSSLELVLKIANAILKLV